VELCMQKAPNQERSSQLKQADTASRRVSFGVETRSPQRAAINCSYPNEIGVGGEEERSERQRESYLQLDVRK
jgi:hypothetical protein